MGAVRTRAVVADDDVLLREGLTSVLERSGFEVIGQCGDGQALTALVRKYRDRFGVVLWGAGVPPAGGQDVQGQAVEDRKGFIWWNGEGIGFLLAAAGRCVTDQHSGE